MLSLCDTSSCLHTTQTLVHSPLYSLSHRLLLLLSLSSSLHILLHYSPLISFNLSSSSSHSSPKILLSSYKPFVNFTFLIPCFCVVSSVVQLAFLVIYRSMKRFYVLLPTKAIIHPHARLPSSPSTSSCLKGGIVLQTHTYKRTAHIHTQNTRTRLAQRRKH